MTYCPAARTCSGASLGSQATTRSREGRHDCHPQLHEHNHRGRRAAAPATSDHANHLNTPTRRVLAVLRIAFGLTFLWAFFDKLFALGFHTGYDQDGKLDRFGDAAWINGGSPTEGFLKFGADGPFKEFYNSHRRHRLGRLGVHARPARHRRRPHLRGGHADRRRRRRPDVRADVDRRTAPGEQPGPRRPPARCAHPRRPRPAPRRRHLGSGPAGGPGPTRSRSIPCSVSPVRTRLR